MGALADALVRMKLVSREHLEEALDAQILNGGRLGTNLVELGFLTEPQLADALVAVHHVPALHGEIVPQPAALARVQPEWCDAHNLLPLRLEGNVLYIGMVDPISDQQLRVLSERLGVGVEQMVVPEFRMNQLLRRYAKAFRPVRQIDLTHAAKLGADSEQAKPSEDLISEEAFEQLYAQALSGGRHSNLEAADAEHAQSDTQSSEAPAPSQPLSFAQAQTMLAQIQDRDGVAHVVMRFAAAQFARALLLTLHGDVAMGWEGAGTLAGNRARRVALPMLAGGTFKLVVESRSHFLGPVKRDPGVDGFFKVIGGAPRTALLLPILARERVVNILYGDHGADRPTAPEIGELMILTQKVGRAYEAILAANKKSRSAARSG